MGHPPAILVSPEQMTHRTRAYLFADATRHALCEVALLLPRSFNPIAYERLFTIVELAFVSSARVPQGTPAPYLGRPSCSRRRSVKGFRASSL